METIQTQKSSGLASGGLRAWGMIALALGAVSRGLLQQSLLGLNHIQGMQLLGMMNDSQTMALVTVALVLEMLEACAVPIFAFLTVEGFRHTGNWRNYLIRVLVLGLVTEIPYDLVTQGTVLAVSEQNPVFGVALALIVLYFYSLYPGKCGKSVIIKILVTLAAMLWASMLHIAYGGCLVFLVAALWCFREKTLLRNLAGPAAALLCSVSNVYFLASPMSFLVLRCYNGEKDTMGTWVKYLAYPVILIVVAAFAWFLE